MKSDFISRSKAKKLGATCLARRNENGQLEAIISLDNAPTVDIKDEIAGAYNEGYMCGSREAEKARPQGEWKLVERDNQDIDVVCPFCNSIRFPAYSHGYTIEEVEEYLIRHHLPKFCEDCGADMKGGAE